MWDVFVYVWSFISKMMDLTQLKKYGITSTALIFGAAGVAYYYLKRKPKVRDATEAFNYLKIKIITDESECDEVVFELRERCKNHRVIGFDCEWVTENGKRRPVSLLQLSTFDGYCALFRLDKINTVPESLKNLLKDKYIYKVGVAPDDDGKYLYKDYLVELMGTLDLRHIANLYGHETGGLAAMAKSLLSIELDKSWRIRCSNWEAPVLSDRQVKYAAADAHVAVRIFARLVSAKNTHSLWSMFQRPNGSVWKDLDKLCWQFSDIHYRSRNKSGDKPTKTKEQVRLTKEIPTSNRYPHAQRTKPLYNNCFLQAPDGELLCTCDKKKAMWYVHKGLATLVKEEPMTVRLRFEPAGRSVGEVGRYYQLTKENKCVVCGSTNSYIRKNVVPREYRKYFPDIIKDHTSHDVVLMCIRCHQRSNMCDLSVRERLAALCAAPLSSACTKYAKYTEDADCKKIRSAARALLYQAEKLPEERRKELENLVLKNFPKQTEVTEEMLQAASELEYLVDNAEYECHGQKVVDYFVTSSEGGLLKLEEMWRAHFLEVMQPKHLPPLWSVDHNEQRLRVRLQEGRLSDEELKQIGVSIRL